MWAFFLLPPATAVSMYAILIAACLVGWYRLGLVLRFVILVPHAAFE
jgi:hypothetical protein